MAQSIVGLTIERDQAKLVRVQIIRGTPKLEAYTTLTWRSANDDQHWAHGLLEELRKNQNQALFQNADLIVNLPSARATTKIISFPFSERRKIESVMANSMEEHLAYAVDQAHFLSTPVSHSKNETQYLCWAIRKNELAEFINLLQQADLEPRAIYPDAFALAALTDSGSEQEKQVRVLFGIFLNHSVVVLKSERTIVQQRTINLGLDQLRASLSRLTQLEQTELSEVLTSGNINQTLQDALSEALAPLKTELSRTVKSIMVQTETSTVACIEVTGDLNCRGPVLEALNRDLDIPLRPLEQLHPLATKIVPSQQSAIDHEVLDYYALPLGLCILGLERFRYKNGNMRSGEFIYRKDIRVLKGRLIGTGLLFLLVLVLGFSSLFYHVNVWEHVYRQKRAELSTIFRAAFPALSQVSSEVQLPLVQQKLTEITRELQSFGKFDEGRPGTLTVLLDVSKAIPSSVVIDIQELSISDSKIDLRGEIDTYKSVDLVRNEIQKLPYIKEVKTGKTTKDVRDEVLVFQMTALFQDEGNRE